ncbi:MAG: hypothetical protein [Lokiarchaeia virus VerdaV1]|uniref:Uncharacterized protein n=1 Tax=Lokiarchaeia virus VerdaV1 TaxID=3070170 RepID=A0AA35CNK5_9CAUD|nr:MAG: hypothetical protein QIT41_gp23 [Lokiarchaeia virus VerdaV1]BDI54872.1 MAG: hypothetical protein [Lokiarchaeia virus VerdaV1]
MYNLYMNINEEIRFIGKIQKQGNYYKIAIPPELVRKNIIKPKAIYQISLVVISE